MLIPPPRIPADDHLGFVLTSALRDAVLGSLSAWRLDAGEGALRLVFVAPPASVRLGVDVVEGTRIVDDLFLRDLVMTAERIGTPGVVAAIRRAGGRPTRRDRVICGRIRRQFLSAPVPLLDMLVVGRDQVWRSRRPLSAVSPATR